ncbi:MAG: hypothetical protein HYY11_02210 [Candidatus Methylomirabilis oxyfera]|nr:hypothetical protein [Candidatus Methylomirabilis oxyfera]
MRSLQLLTRLKLPHSTSLVLVAVSIGIATGLGSVAFIQLLKGCITLFFDGGRWVFPGLGRYYVLLLPAIGGLIVGPLIVRFAREAKGHGVPEVMTALVLRGAGSGRGWPWSRSSRPRSPSVPAALPAGRAR